MYESLNIDLLYVFTTVAELKSINKSSDVLLLSQPAISKKIKQLEDYFGKKLFIRSPRGMALTPAGKLFYSQSKKVLHDFNSLYHLENDQPCSKFSELHIDALDSIASLLYSGFFIEALSRAEQVVLTNKVTDLINDFNLGNLDVIFMDEYSENELTTNFEKYFLQAEPYYVLFSKNNVQLSKIKSPCLSAQELQKFDLLLYPDYCPIHIRIKQIFQQNHLSFPTIYEADYNESTASLVSCSDLVTILPKSLALNKLENPTMQLAAKELMVPDLRRTAVFSNGKIPLNFIVNKLR
ncbi:fhu operon transcription regulator [Ligilactobacillus murinus]|uniref:LysR family transcriptional regulator n=1 Tax=Ligilactobacillus murinus TaxID=1622 RepID=UPI0014335D66|nr:LysR family transcriptional regulator [Ligilactobacillus murinus]BDI00784.1 fhu operon transcription regulator [Ligilactobacillus murinus]GFI64338.1 HTH-type transcriptional regulator GltR [Lactobacillaceae bacterium]